MFQTIHAMKGDCSVVAPGTGIPIGGTIGGTAGVFPSAGAPGIIGGIAMGGACEGIGI